MSHDLGRNPLVEHLRADKAFVAGQVNIAGNFLLSAGPTPKPGDTTNFPAAGLARNEHFVGRVGELAELDRKLAGEAHAVFHAITSDGGFGKSHLAVEYAFRHRDDYAGLWFIDASSPAAADRDGRNILIAISDDPPPSADSAAVAARVAQALSRGRHLLILDDVQDLPAARRRYALADPARLLATTRRNVVEGEGFDPFPLDVLAADDAIALLRGGRADLAAAPHRPALVAVVSHLHFHALAVALAGGYLRRFRHVGAETLLQKLRAAPVGGDGDLLASIDPASAAAGYCRGVAATLALHLPTLGQPTDPTDHLTQRILAVASLIDPRAIPPLLLVAASRPADTGSQESDAEAALLQLVEFSVLRYGEGDTSALLNIHGLTRQLIQSRLAATEPGQSLLAHAAFGLLAAMLVAFSFEANDDPARWPGLDRLLPHAEAVLRPNVGRQADPAWAHLCNQVGYFAMNARHRLGEALWLFGEAERIDREVFGGDHPSVAVRVNNLGNVLQARGDLAEALARYEEAERINRAAYGDNHPSVAIDVNNIGRVLRARGDLAGALGKFQEAERIDRAVHGDGHPSVAIDVNNIGLVLKDGGNLAGAQAKFEEAERIDRAAHRDNHPAVARDVNNIGSVLLARKDLAGAQAKFEEAEWIDRAVHGDNHPSVAIDVNNIGEMLRARGDLAGALGKFEEAERIDRAVYGGDHPSVAVRVSNIGGVLHARGDLAGALAKCEEAFDILLRARGPRGEGVGIMARNMVAAGGDPIERARRLAGDTAAEALREFL